MDNKKSAASDGGDVGVQESSSSSTVAAPTVSKIKRLLLSLQTAWSIIGISCVLFLIVNLATRIIWDRFIVPGIVRTDLAEVSGIEDQEVLRDFSLELYQSHDTFWESGIRWQPYVYWRSLPFEGRYVNVTADGLRHTVSPSREGIGNSEAKPVRIFMFGGSTLWGSGVRDAYTIPSLLQASLVARGLNVEVTNFGQLGYVSTQEMLTFILEVQQGNVPDLVVFYDGVNETRDGLTSERAGLTGYDRAAVGNFQLVRNPSALDLFSLYARTEDLPELILGPRGQDEAEIRRHVEQKVKNKTIQGIAAEIVDTYMANVTIIKAVAKRFGCEARFYWQPVVFSKISTTAMEQQIIEKQSIGSFFELVYAMVRQRNTGIDRNHSEVQYIADVFDTPEWSNKSAFFDLCHVGEPANEAIAKRIDADLAAVVSRISLRQSNGLEQRRVRCADRP